MPFHAAHYYSSNYYLPPNYYHFLEMEQLYDQVDQFLENHQQPLNQDEEDEDEDEDEDYQYDDDEDEDEDEEEEEEEQEEEQGDEDDSDSVIVLGSSRVSQNEAASTPGQASIIVEEAINQDNVVAVGGREKRRRTVEEGEATSVLNRGGGEDGVKEGEWNRSEIDGLFCPICMEAWTSDGEHYVCCLPCGHIYGMSCIKKWIQQLGRLGKCPQCNMKCKLKDVRKLYASQIVVVDEESQKKIRHLEAECDSLEKKGAVSRKKETEWQKKEADLRLQVQQLTERTTYLERLLGDMQSRSFGVLSSSGGSQDQALTGINSNFCRQGSCSFMLQRELRVDGARLFDIDACSQIAIIARRVSGMGGMHLLTKMSLISPYETEDILLPPSIKAVKDLRISTLNSRLALLASLGKKLSVLSTESNHIILSYDLPVPAWSCSWDVNSPHYIYAGLQNGVLSVFDIRQTTRPVQSMSGLSSNPIHSIHSLSHNPTLSCGDRSILTASSAGLSQWTFGGADERQLMIPETENQGVCISLAYCGKSDDIVASFRPKVENLSDMVVSQPSLTPAVIGQGTQGSHVLYNRVGNSCYQRLGSAHATVNDIRFLKSAVINVENGNRFFASGDEVTSELVFQDLPSFSVTQRHKPHKHSILDVKCSYAFDQSLVSCLSEDTFQLFHAKLS